MRQRNVIETRIELLNGGQVLVNIDNQTWEFDNKCACDDFIYGLQMLWHRVLNMEKFALEHRN